MGKNELFCPKCSGTRIIRAGFVNGKQRHKCKQCGFHFSIAERGRPAAIKRLAIHMYLEGMGFRAIGRALEVSDVAVAKWIGPAREVLDPMRKPSAKLKEIGTYENFYRSKEIFSRFGWLLIGTEDNEGECLYGSNTSGNAHIE